MRIAILTASRHFIGVGELRSPISTWDVIRRRLDVHHAASPHHIVAKQLIQQIRGINYYSLLAN